MVGPAVAGAAAAAPASPCTPRDGEAGPRRGAVVVPIPARRTRCRSPRLPHPARTGGPDARLVTSSEIAYERAPPPLCGPASERPATGDDLSLAGGPRPPESGRCFVDSVAKAEQSPRDTTIRPPRDGLSHPCCGHTLYFLASSSLRRAVAEPRRAERRKAPSLTEQPSAGLSLRNADPCRTPALALSSALDIFRAPRRQRRRHLRPVVAYVVQQHQPELWPLAQADAPGDLRVETGRAFVVEEAGAAQNAHDH